MNGRASILTLEGEWDYYRAGELRGALDQHASARDLILDLSAVSYLDSTMLNQLVRLRQERARNRLPQERIVLKNPSLRRIFEIANFNAIWPIYDTLEEARKR